MNTEDHSGLLELWSSNRVSTDIGKTALASEFLNNVNVQIKKIWHPLARLFLS